MPRVDLVHLFPYLRYFCDAAVYGGVTAAAKRNHVTQSAVSQGIKKLESAIGKKLTSQHPNRFHLNTEGRQVLEKGLHLLQQVCEWENDLADPSQALSGRMHFACTHSFALSMLAKPLKGLMEQNPELEVRCRLAHPGRIKNLLRSGAIDVGIVLDNDDFSDFSIHPLFEGEYGIYASPKLKKPESRSFIVSEDRLETTLLKASYEKKFGCPLPELMKISSWQVIANFTHEGIGLGFIPDYVASNPRNRLKRLDFGLPPIPYRVIALLPPNNIVPRHVQVLLDLIVAPSSAQVR